jgi:hypothetical protein
VSGADDGIAECAFRVSSGKERFSDEAKLGGVVCFVTGSVCFESGGELVGEDRMVQGVDHVGVGDAVLACAGSDERRTHFFGRDRSD